MKTITLIKQHPNIQLGHLYEHLYMKQLNSFFYKKGLYKLLDYAAIGTTFDNGGIIMVSVELYTKKAATLADKLLELTIEYGDDNTLVERALHQISAEEKTSLHISSGHELITELGKLDALAWQHIDKIDSIDTSKIHCTNTPLTLTKKRINPKKIQITIKTNRKDPDTLVLFNFISRLLLHIAGDRLCATYGLYTKELSCEKNSSEMTLTGVPTVMRVLSPNLIGKDCLSIFENIIDTSVLDDIVKEFENISYENNSVASPNADQLLKETGVLIGSKGWSRIVNRKNLLKLIKDIDLEVKIGRQEYVAKNLIKNTIK